MTMMMILCLSCRCSFPFLFLSLAFTSNSSTGQILNRRKKRNINDESLFYHVPFLFSFHLSHPLFMFYWLFQVAFIVGNGKVELILSFSQLVISETFRGIIILLNRKMRSLNYVGKVASFGQQISLSLSLCVAAGGLLFLIIMFWMALKAKMVGWIDISSGAYSFFLREHGGVLWSEAHHYLTPGWFFFSSHAPLPLFIAFFFFLLLHLMRCCP